jgi:type II secretory pathway component PulC
LGSLAAAEIASGAPPEAAARAAGNAALSEPVQDAAGHDFSLPPLTSFSEISQRPLFNATRRPALATDQSGQAWSSFVLKGVIVSPIAREALLLHDKQAAIVSLREGEILDGWIAESILPDRVVFRKGAEEQELKLAAARDNQKPAPADRPPAVLPPPLARPEPPRL